LIQSVSDPQNEPPPRVLRDAKIENQFLVSGKMKSRKWAFVNPNKGYLAEYRAFFA
jgi:hypothetical protein